MNFKPLLGATVAGLSLVALLPGQQPATSTLVPTGVTDTPNEPFDIGEHGHVHSSTALQGMRSSIKYAPVMYGPGGPAFGGFQTAVVVNNPDPTQFLDVNFTYHDRNGLILNTSFASIDPLGTYAEPTILDDFAGNSDSLGTVRVSVASGSAADKFVGATVYFAEQLIEPIDVGILDVDGFVASMQPLQDLNRHAVRTTFGPIPVYSPASTSLELVNGIFGFVNVINPVPLAHNVQVVISSSVSGVISSTPVTIPAFGAYQEVGAWILAANNYVTGAPDEELMVTVISLESRPVTGELIMLDLASSADFSDQYLVSSGGDTRMTSTIGADLTNRDMVNPEVVTMGGMETAVGLANVGAANSGPITVTYWSGNGAALGSDTIPSLPTLGAVVIGQGMPLSPGFPNNVDGAWIQISATEGGLIGWSMRGLESAGAGSVARGYADLLYGNSLLGHSAGWLDGNRRRLVAPLAFDAGDSVLDPGYIAFMNDAANNIGNYEYEFWNRQGVPAGVGAYAGLRAYDSSRSYEDNIITPTGIFDAFHMGRVSVATARVKGICAIGGPLVGRLPFEGNFGYPGPGDIVPPPN